MSQWTSTTVSGCIGIATALILVPPMYVASSSMVVTLISVPFLGLGASFVAWLLMHWVAGQSCVVVLHSVINVMLPGRRELYRECLADRPLSVRSIRVLNHARNAAFADQAPLGPLCALAYSEFLVGPCWVFLYESLIANITGLSTASRRGIGAVAAQGAGSDLMSAWYVAQYREAKVQERLAPTGRDADDLLPALDGLLLATGQLDFEPVALVMNKYGIDPIRRAHVIAAAMASTFECAIARCFCDWPWSTTNPLGLLHRFVVRHLRASEAVLRSNARFEGASFGAMSSTDASFRSADRDNERSVEELPNAIHVALSPLGAVLRASEAWHRATIRASRQALRKESRDIVDNFVVSTRRPGRSGVADQASDSWTLATIAKAVDTTPHRGDKAAMMLALVVAIKPTLITQGHLMAALHEKGALGALHAACLGATLRAVEVGLSLA